MKGKLLYENILISGQSLYMSVIQVPLDQQGVCLVSSQIDS